jgi:hypothetical protein
MLCACNNPRTYVSARSHHFTRQLRAHRLRLTVDSTPAVSASSPRRRDVGLLRVRDGPRRPTEGRNTRIRILAGRAADTRCSDSEWRYHNVSRRGTTRRGNARARTRIHHTRTSRQRRARSRVIARTQCGCSALAPTSTVLIAVCILVATLLRFGFIVSCSSRVSLCCARLSCSPLHASHSLI